MVSVTAAEQPVSVTGGDGGKEEGRQGGRGKGGGGMAICRDSGPLKGTCLHGLPTGLRMRVLLGPEQPTQRACPGPLPRGPAHRRTRARRAGSARAGARRGPTARERGKGVWTPENLGGMPLALARTRRRGGPTVTLARESGPARP